MPSATSRPPAAVWRPNIGPSSCRTSGRRGVDRRTKVELFEQLRREYEFGIGTIKGVARKFGVHRRLVRQAVNSALPPDRTYRQRSKPVLGAVEEFIDGILEEDRHAPRKQRHTARRIYHRILAEMPGHTVAAEVVEVGGLTHYDRPMPCLTGYDRLLDRDQEAAP
jgi:hypothetical protein